MKNFRRADFTSNGSIGQRPQLAKMEPHCLGKPEDPGRSGKNNRLFLEAVLWIVRTGSPWRDLPAMFGNSRTDWIAWPRLIANILACLALSFDIC